MKIKLSPKEVLVAVITYYVNKELPEEVDTEITAKFTDDEDGSVELVIPEDFKQQLN